MLSILIPTYNYSVCDLVHELVSQVDRLRLHHAEIIIGEDGSEDIFIKQNSLLKDLFYVRQSISKKNLGRSATRNRLAEVANNDLLLFIDADSEVRNDAFLSNYLDFIYSDVTVGGTDYRDHDKLKSNKTLRYYYGIRREQFDEGNVSSKGFAANNFVIKRNVFLKIKFDEKITSYGHEDTLFGKRLIENGFSVKFINNPVTHIGLESSAEFLEKSKEAIYTLVELIDTERLSVEDVNLSNVATKIHPLVSHLIVKLDVIFGLEKIVERNLLGDSPNLTLFDLWKLIVYLKIVN